MFQWWPAIAIASVLLGISCAAISFRTVADNNRREHAARSFFAAGIGLFSVGTALLTFYFTADATQHRQSDIDRQERLAIAQRFYWATLQYGMSAYQISSTRHYCGMILSENPKLDRGACRESAAYAAKVSTVLPGTETIVEQAAGHSDSLSRSERVATVVMDGDISLRARIPAIIETNITGYLNQGRTNDQDVRLKFPTELFELQQNAEGIATIFCILSHELKLSWVQFNEAVGTLEAGLQKAALAADVSYLQFLKDVGGKYPFAKSHCANVRREVKGLLPGAGGGNGGGGGGGR